MSLLPFFQWCEGTLIGTAIQQSLWLFPVVEAVHVLGLALLGGTLLLVDLRLLGIGLTTQPVSDLARQLQPWLIGSVGALIATGVPLFLSEAVKCYYNDAFWVKITTLPVALLFTFTVRRAVTLAEDGRLHPLVSRATAVASLALWFTVAAAGRWIGFSS
jgi:hypothetical protein